MLAAAARFLPAIRSFTRQIIPPVVATLLAAVLIAGYNRAFMGHLVQPRMGMLHGDIIGTDEAPRPAGTPATAKLREATDAIIVAEPVSAHNRVFSKDNDREAAKDDTALKTAAAPAVEPVAVEAAASAAEPAPVVPPAPPVARAPARKVEPRLVERRPVEPRPYGAPVVVSQPPVILAQPPTAGPAPVIATAPVAAPYPGYPMQQPVAQEPPPVISAKPIVTVPDRPRAAYPQNAPYEAAAPDQAIAPPPPPQGGPLERFVDTVKPSSIFARMRELGERIEAAGNDILPSIRQ